MAAEIRFQLGISGAPSGSSRKRWYAVRSASEKTATIDSSSWRSKISPLNAASA